jgi:hypothetical protein
VALSLARNKTICCSQPRRAEGGRVLSLEDEAALKIEVRLRGAICERRRHKCSCGKGAQTLQPASANSYFPISEPSHTYLGWRVRNSLYSNVVELDKCRVPRRKLRHFSRQPTIERPYLTLTSGVCANPGPLTSLVYRMHRRHMQGESSGRKGVYLAIQIKGKILKCYGAARENRATFGLRIKKGIVRHRAQSNMKSSVSEAC